MTEPMKPRMVRMSDDLYAAVRRVADELDRSPAWVIRQAVTEYVEGRR